MNALSNYDRGIIYRDKRSLEFLFQDFYRKSPDFLGSEAFIVAYSMSELSDGQLSTDLVYFGSTELELVILGGDKVLVRVPFEKLQKFYWKEFEERRYYFPPAIPPKRAGIFEVEWKNSDGRERNLMIMFPSPAIHKYELDYSSEAVHKQLIRINIKNPYFSSEATRTHLGILGYLPTAGIPNEVNQTPCRLNDFLGFD